MARKKKEEVIMDFGKIKVPTKWDEVTLQQMCDYLRRGKEKEDKYAEDCKAAREGKLPIPNKEHEMYNLTDKDLIECFTELNMEQIEMLPSEFYASILSNFAFVAEELKADPKKELYVGMDKFIVNDKETLKVKEYEDVTMILNNDPYDYPSLLAILLRKVKGRKTDNATGLSWLVNEDYNSEFANKIFDARREMWARMPITEVFPIIKFFFLKTMLSETALQRYSTIQDHQLRDIAEHISSLQEATD